MGFEDLNLMREVFPAYAGMSPETHSCERHRDCFPRLRGDEPPTSRKESHMRKFSPPTRG